MKTFSRYFLSLLLMLMPVFSFPTTSGQGQTKRKVTAQAEASPAEEPEIGERAQRQIEALLEQKQNRTPEQQKMDPNLVVGAQQQTQKAQVEGISTVATEIQLDERRRALVDIRGTVTAEILQKIEQVGGEIIFSSASDQSIRAHVPLRNLEEFAGMTEVTYIESAVESATHHQINRPLPANPISQMRPSESPEFAKRVATLKAKLAAALSTRKLNKARFGKDEETNAIVTGPPVSEGDRAHQADILRNVFGFDGTGVRIGVLSDSVRFLSNSQASGNLPPDVTVLPGQSGITSTSSGTGEGTAMLEIVYDLAPGAKLFFATANNGDASFANNIRSLRFTYNCDIIVDDVFYFNEHPFQDALITRAVNDVTAAGALYFSSAGNEGNINDGTSGVWEGDYLDGGTLTPITNSYRVHSFGERLISNRIRTASPFGYALFWSDPWGGSSNDYDLFILDSTLSTVKKASLSDQTGTQNPYEFISSTGIVAGDRIVIANFRAQPRALHLNSMRGQLAISTIGQTRGHSSAASAFSVAAVNAAVANGGAFVGGNTNPVETFSADGPRRLFFNPDGSPIVPGNFLFTTNGGTIRQKPDIAAADGVSTSVPGFSSFFGTSAAAPHAAAIAALLKSAAPSLTNAQIRNLMISTALDIGPLGWDRTAGIGIVTPLGSYLAYSPSPLIEFKAAEITPLEGDGDRFVEPGETARVNVILFNSGNMPATGLKVKLTATTPGVTVLADESDYFQIAAGKAGVNLSPFRIKLADSVGCGARVNLTANVSSNGQRPRAITFSVPTGQPGSIAQTFAYTGTPVSIPDGNTAGVAIRLPISGVTNSISKVSFRINGDNCSSPTGVGLQHTWVGDLTLRLISPSGTVVTLMSAPGGNLNFGQNFCNTLLDDAGTTSIQNIGTGGTYSGTFRPASPLAAFIGENANGNWTLQVIDSSTPDAGIMRSFSVLITAYDCVRGTSVVEVSSKRQ